MTYRWRKELAVTKFMMFSLKPTSTSATKPTPFGNAYSPVRVTPIKSPKRYWMSQWASEYTESSLIKKILPQGSAAVSCCSWFSAFILGALQGALMFCLLIHFKKLLFARCDWNLNTCRLCTTSFAGLLSKHSRMSPRLGTFRWYWILSICCKNQTKILCQRYPVQPHLITAKFWTKLFGKIWHIFDISSNNTVFGIEGERWSEPCFKAIPLILAG